MRSLIQYRLFADIEGRTVELFGYITGMDRAEFSARFPRVKGRRFDSKRYQVAADADGRIMPVTRAVEYKKTRSPRRCDARCLNARGPNCECQCGGVNHGAGDAGATPDMFEDDPGDGITRAGFADAPPAAVPAPPAGFALEFSGGSLNLGGDQLSIAGIGGADAPRVIDPRQIRMF